MKFKQHVDPRYLGAPAWYGLWLADELHKKVTGRDAVCTSTGEGRHSVMRSMHYTGAYGRGHGRAFDLRIWHLENPAEFTRKLKKRLGPDYVVLLEKTHIHVHWGPVYHESTKR